MKFISVLLFSISSNLDNLIIGAAYGMRKIKITLLYNFIIAFVTYISTFLAMILGKGICHFLKPSIANILGSCILIFIGIGMIINDISKTNTHKINQQNTDFVKINSKTNLHHYEEILEDPNKITKELPEYMTIKEVLYLALALALNNVAIGISASITGLNIFFTCSCTFLFSMISIYLGYSLGKKFLSDFLGKYTGIISGIIIIVLGIYEIFI